MAVITTMIQAAPGWVGLGLAVPERAEWSILLLAADYEFPFWRFDRRPVAALQYTSVGNRWLSEARVRRRH